MAYPLLGHVVSAREVGVSWPRRHRSSPMLNHYRRGARRLAWLRVSWFAPLDELLRGGLIQWSPAELVDDQSWGPGRAPLRSHVPACL
jgi:hypothetical protein